MTLVDPSTGEKVPAPASRLRALLQVRGGEVEPRDEAQRSDALGLSTLRGDEAMSDSFEDVPPHVRRQIVAEHTMQRDTGAGVVDANQSCPECGFSTRREYVAEWQLLVDHAAQLNGRVSELEHAIRHAIPALNALAEKADTFELRERATGLANELRVALENRGEA